MRHSVFATVLVLFLIFFSICPAQEDVPTLDDCRGWYDGCVADCESWCEKEAAETCARGGNYLGCEFDRFCCGPGQCGIIYSSKWCPLQGYNACAENTLERYRNCMEGCNGKIRNASTEEERKTVRMECPPGCDRLIEDEIESCKSLACRIECGEKGFGTGRWVGYHPEHGWDSCACEEGKGEDCSEVCAGKGEHAVWDGGSAAPNCGCLCEKGWQMTVRGCLSCDDICSDRGEHLVYDPGTSDTNICGCRCEDGFVWNAGNGACRQRLSEVKKPGLPQVSKPPERKKASRPEVKSKPAPEPAVRKTQSPPKKKEKNYYVSLSSVRESCFALKSGSRSCREENAADCATIRPKYKYHQNMIIRGVGGSVTGSSVERLSVLVAPLNTDGSLGDDLICRGDEGFNCRRAGDSEGDTLLQLQDMEAWVLLPEGYVAVGCGMRVNKGDLKTLVLYGREYANRSLTGETVRFAGGVEPDRDTECEAKYDDRVLTGIGARVRQSDIRWFYVSSAGIDVKPLP